MRIFLKRGSVAFGRFSKGPGSNNRLKTTSLNQKEEKGIKKRHTGTEGRQNRHDRQRWGQVGPEQAREKQEQSDRKDGQKLGQKEQKSWGLDFHISQHMVPQGHPQEAVLEQMP